MTAKNGFFVDCDGNTCSTVAPGEGLRCLLDGDNIDLIDSQDFVVYEATFFPSIASLEAEGVEVQVSHKGTVFRLSPAERVAAAEFCQACEGTAGYDVPKAMMARLTDIGMVEPIGDGSYMQTEVLEQFSANNLLG